MTARIFKAAMVAAALTLGLWGCAQGAPSGAGQADKVRQLEGKCAKLETACKDAEAAREQADKQLAALREEAGRLKKSLEIQKGALEERDALRLEVEARAAERDALKGRCDTLKTGLQNLLRQADALGSSPPITAAPVSSPANRS